MMCSPAVSRPIYATWSRRCLEIRNPSESVPRYVRWLTSMAAASGRVVPWE